MVMVGLVALIGLVAIALDLKWWMAIVLGMGIAVLSCPKVHRKPLKLLAAALLSVSALVGLNVIAHRVDLPKLPIELGLLVAFAVIAVTICWFLVLAGWELPAALAAGVLTGAFLILVPPVLYGVLTAKDQTGVPKSALVPSQLDLLIVTNGARHSLPPEVPADPALEDFAVRYSVGYAEGNAVRWTLVDGESRDEALRAAAEGSGRPAAGEPATPPGGSDTALALFVDGTPPVVPDATELPDRPPQRGEVARWRQLAEAAAPLGTPIFALLQTRRARRLRAWRGFAPDGRAFSLQTLGGRTATDAAFRLTVRAPVSESEMALAVAYQPILLFDKDEPVPWMFSISDLFAEGKIQLCKDPPVGATECDSVQHPRELMSGGTHLRVDTPEPETIRARAKAAVRLAAAAVPAEPAGPGAAPGGTPPPGTAPSPAAASNLPGSGAAIYVHPIEHGRGGQRRLYLDYWWYLSDNPVEVGGGALCGFGLYIVGITCQNHQSDWEGMTVVIDRSGSEPHPIAVQYAQHANVIRYDWGALEAYWRSDKRSQELTQNIPGALTRPLAYIAQGTHASYPFHCGECNEVVHSELSEGPHRGGTEWVGNISSACGEDACLQLLPTHDRGHKPALWNAYEGSWGDFHCKFKYYCDSGPPPPSPGAQGRYEHPWHNDGTGDEQGGFVAGLIEE